MSPPALIYLALTFIGLGGVASKHGQPRTGSHSFWKTVAVTILVCGLLYWGGFFDRVSP